MTPQSARIVLASGSDIRAKLLKNAGLAFDVRPGRVDEEAVRAAHMAEGGSPRDLADLLAEMKARKISERDPGALVIGADQVLVCDGKILAKPASPDEARAHLRLLSGKSHRLLSAAVVCQGGEPLWRHVGQVRLTMRPLSDAFVSDYVGRNWDGIRHAVGCYKIEEEGVRLFAGIEGDFFHILGLPLIELLTWLTIRGDIAT